MDNGDAGEDKWAQDDAEKRRFSAKFLEPIEEGPTMKKVGTTLIKLNWDECRTLAARVADEIQKYSPSNKPIRLYGVPRGGTYAALLVVAELNDENWWSILVEAAEEADIFIDDIIDSGATKKTFHLMHSTKPFFALITKDNDCRQWYSFPWERSTTNKDECVENNVLRILQYLGEDITREGLKDTPARVVRSWDELYKGYGQNPSDVLTVFTEKNCDEMVILKNIEFYSTCEHHMQPFFGKAHIGYLPKNGRVVGISKLARLLEVFARRLQIQERIGMQITEALMKELDCLGCGCVLEARHFCMTCRGVQKQNSVMITSSMKGVFREDPSAKAEFLGIIQK